MRWKSESEIREIVREELRRLLDEQTNSKIKRVYDEGGRIIESDYTYVAGEGHVVHVITKHQGLEIQSYAGHSRTQKNWEQLQSEKGDVEYLDRKFNEDNVFRGNGPIPTGFISSPGGLIVPERRASQSR
jgi:hypothetical protein